MKVNAYLEVVMEIAPENRPRPQKCITIIARLSSTKSPGP